MKRLVTTFLPVALGAFLLSSCLFQTGDGSALTTFSMPMTDEVGLEMLELPDFTQEDLILRHDGFVVSYDTDAKIPKWVAYELTAEELDGNVPRARSFSMDLGYKGRQAMREDYSNTGWDKGHMAPSADMKWSQTAMSESFYLTNVCPQNPDLNGRD